MSVSGSRFKFILLAVVMCAFTLNVSAATKRKPKPAKQEQPAPPPPAIVEVPTPAELTLEQKPAVPPKVTYQDRKLTIVAENSSLGDILRAVKTQTGASIDLPANTNARIVTQLGPGPSRDVVAQLLNGTLFNYVLLGTVNDPAAIGKIILIPKPMAGGTESAANVQPNMQQPQNYPAVNMPNQAGEEADPDAETNTTTEEENTPNVPETEQPGAPAPNGAQQNLRTPEQLLQELQRQQQLQQQLQQQQGTAQPNQQQPEQNPQQ